MKVDMRINFLWKLFCTLFLFLILIILNIYIFNIFPKIKKYDDIKVKLIGNDNIIIPINTAYTDEGFKISVGDKTISEDSIKYEIENNVLIDQIGKYEIKYHVHFNNNLYHVTRYVEVVDNIAPDLVVLTNKVSKTNSGNNLRYYAFDNYDGVITEKVEVLEESDKYILKVKDSSNNETIKEVEKSDNINDYVLELNGTLIQYVALNTEYVEKGINITNIKGKKLNIKYMVDGNVDVTKDGVYLLKYYIEGVDSYQERIVKVYNKLNTKLLEDGTSKKIYLTFDDGPGQYTEELLKILDKYNVKATFFVTGQFKKYIPLIKNEIEAGHKVAVHTMSHEWKLYRSFENYYKDFNDINDIIEQYSGSRSKLFRFPGGGSNTISRGKSLGIMGYLSTKMTELGYVYYDWNVDSGDAAGANSSKIYNNVINGINSRNVSVVLMHDIKRPTIDTIEKIIVYALENGYTFDVLSESSITVHHHVNN